MIINKEIFPLYLAILVTILFFTLLFTLAYHPLPQTAHDILIGLLGSVGTSWVTVINYYFGSSSGSAKKTEILNEKEKDKT